MKRVDALIALLSGTSVVLTVLIVLTATGRGPLEASAVDRTNGFVAVTAQAEDDRESLWIIDERSGQMAVFIFNRNRRDMELKEVRDLRAEFDIKLSQPPGGERPTKPE